MKENRMNIDPGSNEKNKKIIIVAITLLSLIAVMTILSIIFDDDINLISIEPDDKRFVSEYRMSGNSLENFDLKFLQLEINEQNLVYSPLSIKYALAMLSEGSADTSKAQIDALIGNYKTNKYINSSNISFANAMFIRDTYKDSIKEEYITTLQEKFEAEIVYDPFESVSNLNLWVKNKTLGLIENLINDVTNKQFYLINALAVDMEWNKAIQATTKLEDMYSVNYTHENYVAYIKMISDDNYDTIKFNNGTINSKAVEIGASINNYDIINEIGEENIRETITKEYSNWLETYEYVPEDADDVDTYVDKYIEELKSNYGKIETSTDFKFYDDNEVKVFSKDLKEYNGTTLEYISIMPKNLTLSEYVKNIDAKKLNAVINKIKAIELDNFEQGKITKITGGIPLFKYEYELSLQSDLKYLGVTDIFSQNKANLSGLSKAPNVFIDDTKHKTNIEFSNEGIKAASVTSIGGLGSAGGFFEYLYDVPVVTIDLNFDNPYLYIIRDKDSGEVWFIGTVYHPLENNNINAKIINQ